MIPEGFLRLPEELRCLEARLFDNDEALEGALEKLAWPGDFRSIVLCNRRAIHRQWPNPSPYHDRGVEYLRVTADKWCRCRSFLFGTWLGCVSKATLYLGAGSTQGFTSRRGDLQSGAPAKLNTLMDLCNDYAFLVLVNQVLLTLMLSLNSAGPLLL